MNIWTYRKDQELPDMVGSWFDGDGNLIDFSTGWTLTVKIAAESTPHTVLLTKTAGVTGAAAEPNWRIAWSTTDFSDLPADPAGTIYIVHLYARRNSDNKDRVFSPAAPPRIRLLPAPV